VLNDAKIAKKNRPSPFKEKLKSAIKKRVAKPKEQAAEPLSQALAMPSPQPEAVTGTTADSDSQTSEAGMLEPIRAIADYLHNPKPHYPGIARNRGWEGLVQLRVYVTAEGLCGNIELYQGSGHEELDEAAMAAVSAWQFVPAKLDDAPIAGWVIVPIEFNLRDE
jgi:periplasmic protein TonB